MALTLTRASSEHLHTPIPADLAVPFTWSIRFWPNDVTSTYALVDMEDNGGNEYCSLFVHPSADHLLVDLKTDPNANNRHETGNSTIEDTWNHAFFAFRSNTERRLILNGDTANADTETDNRGIAADYLRITLGAFYWGTGGPSDFPDGRFAEFAMWNVGLTDDEAVLLNAGVSPLFIRPANLMMYVPMHSTAYTIDMIRGATITQVNTPTDAEHPIVHMPKPGPLRGFVAAAAAGAALVKVATETVEIGEAIRRPLALRRARAETVEISETIRRPRVLRRLLAETVEIAEALRRPLALRRRLAETVELLDVLVRQRGLLRLVSDTVEITDAIRRPLSLRRARDETVEISETIRRPMVLRRLLAETLEITDAIARLLAMRRFHADTVEISETIRRPLSLRRLVNETVEITETLASSMATLLIKIIQDTIEITEGVRRALGLKRQADETVEITEALRRPLSLRRLANETVEIVEALLRPRVLVRLHTATVEITSAVARRVALRRLVSTTVEIGEALRRPLALSRARSETVEITETTRRPMVLRRLLAETVEITETIRRSSGLVGVMVRVVNEALQIGEGRQVALTVTNLALATVRVYRATASAYVKGRNFVARIVRPSSSAEIDR